MVDWHELEESEKREFAQRELLGDQPSHVHSSLGRWLEELGAFCGQGCGATHVFPTQRYRLYHGKFLHEPKKLGAGV